MSQVIHLHADPHEQTQMLLPWYVNGTLEEQELAVVEAHLAACPECRNELAGEQALAHEIARLPAEVEPGWAALKSRAETGARRVRLPATQGSRPATRSAPGSIFGRRVALGWAVAAQAAVVVLGLGAAFLAAPRMQHPQAQTQPAYHVLGATPAAADGNLLVMFKPTASEQDLRMILMQAGARVVDGPTATGGYVLHVPAAQRDVALTKLRAGHDVVLAEAIDAGLRP